MLTYYVGPYNLPAIPFGVVGLVVLVPVFWALPRRWIRAGLITSSLSYSLLTWPIAWCATLFGAVLYGYAVVATCQHWAGRGPCSGGESAGTRARGTTVFAWLAIHLAYVPVLIWPQPPWLPRDAAGEIHPYYWVQWFGMGYVALRSLHIAVDVSRGRVAGVRFSDYLAYMLFPPTVRMGPIIRFQDFMGQLEAWPAQRTGRQAVIGLGRIVVGLVRLGLMFFVVSAAMEHDFWRTPQHFSRLVVFRSAVLAPFFLYLWMSGYVDLAIGVGRMMGFVVPENFRGPWRSDSLREFWKRWHITLGAWLFDYVYIPLGGNRRHVLINYLVTFLYCAAWHGLVGSYFAWALTQAVGLYVNRAWCRYWSDHRERQTAIYRKLREWRWVGGHVSRRLSGCLTVAYQILTLAIFMDEKYAGVRWIGYLLGLYPG